jgi:hypothetical protein
MKMRVCWDVASCSILDTDRRFRRANCLRYNASSQIMETVSTSEMSVNFYETTWRNVKENDSFQNLFHCLIFNTTL